MIKKTPVIFGLGFQLVSNLLGWDVDKGLLEWAPNKKTHQLPGGCCCIQPSHRDPSGPFMQEFHCGMLPWFAEPPPHHPPRHHIPGFSPGMNSEPLCLSHFYPRISVRASSQTVLFLHLHPSHFSFATNSSLAVSCWCPRAATKKLPQFDV